MSLSFGRVVSLREAYPTFYNFIDNGFSQMGTDISSVVAFVMLESESIDQKFRLNIAPRRGVNELNGWFYSERVPIRALEDPESEQGQRALEGILKSLKTALSDANLACVRCNKVTDHRYVHKFPDAIRGDWLVAQCIECANLGWWFET